MFKIVAIFYPGLHYKTFFNRNCDNNYCAFTYNDFTYNDNSYNPNTGDITYYYITYN